MLMTLIMMVLGLSGGLCIGTIAFSAYKFAAFEKTAMSVFHRAGVVTLG